MGFARQLYRYLKTLAAILIRLVFGVIYVHLDIYLQKRRLRGYKSDIKAVTRHSDARSGAFCIFVFYEPEGQVSASVQRALAALTQRGVHVLLACNHTLSDTQTAYFTNTCHSVITRGNTGYDFGAYKDVFLWLGQQGFDVQRLGLMNDSVFYASAGLPEFIDSLFGEAEVIAAFENWGEQYHLNSFALTMSGAVVQSPQMQGFWRGYLPVSNRIHAIEAGEKGLSKVALSATESSQILYPTAQLHEILSKANLDQKAELLHLPYPWSEAYTEAEGGRPITAREIAEVINKTSPLHAGAYYFPRYMGCPIFKKDIVYRRRFDFWAVEHWISDVLPPKEAEEYLTLLRRRGDAKSLPLVQRCKYYVGVA